MKTLLESLRAVRPDNWWFSKMPPLLAVAYLDISRGHIGPASGTPLLLCMLFSVSCVASYGHVVNDIFDVAADARAGKSNSMAGATHLQRTVISTTFLVLGFAPALVMPYSPMSLILLALNCLWPTIYSLPATRLKERGIAGVVCDAMGSHLTPTLFVLALFGSASNTAPEPLFRFAITAWAAVLGIKGILHHQIADRANDIRSGTVTFTTETGAERTSRFIAAFNLMAELPISFILVILVREWAPLALISFVAYCTLESAKYKLGFKFALGPEAWSIRPSLPFTDEAFYVAWLPVAAALQMAISDVVWLWVPVVHILLFYRTVSAQVSTLVSVVQVARRQMRK